VAEVSACRKARHCNRPFDIPAATSKGAACAPPQAPGRGADGHVEGPRLPRVELCATTNWRGSWPHGEAAIVGDGERGCIIGGSEKEDREEMKSYGGFHCHYHVCSASCDKPEMNFKSWW